MPALRIRALWRGAPLANLPWSAGLSIWLLLMTFLGCARERQPLAHLEVDFTEIRLAPGSYESVNLSLSAELHPLRGGYPWMFVHLREAAGGEIVRTFDQQPPGWPLGETITYPLILHQNALTEPLASGDYDLVAGIYDPRTRERFPLEGLNKSSYGWRVYELGRVQVDATPSISLDYDWYGAWEREFEATGDRQVSQRRWWNQQASLEIRGPVAESLDLWIQIFGPELNPAKSVLVEVDCTGASKALTCPRQSFRLGLPALEPGEHCRIDFSAEHSLQIEGAPGPRSAALEILAWRPAQSRVLRSNGDHAKGRLDVGTHP